MQEAEIQQTPEGQVPVDGGWFILNLGEIAWETVPGFGVWCGFDRPERDSSTPGVGVHVHVLKPGEANGLYHAEAAQEGFLVLSGECIAIVEGQERRMRQWDYLHSPPGTAHMHGRCRRGALRDLDVRQPRSRAEGRMDRSRGRG